MAVNAPVKRFAKPLDGKTLAMEHAAVTKELEALDYQPLTSPVAGRLLYDFVLASGVEDVLELGFAHGTSTAYIAAALEERGVGLVTTIDRQNALARRPNIHELLRHLGLEAYVRPIFAEDSYNWELMRLLERQSPEGQAVPCLDFCFFDGAHTWDEDGLAFFLVDKLLRPDRWLLFDDLRWSQEASPSFSPEKAKSVPEEQRRTAQVLKVFDLLVRQHPSYADFRVMGSYGWAYKNAEIEPLHAADVDEATDPSVLRQLAFGSRKAGPE
jgi:predicted O-methyltransferase YrrM